MPALRDKPRRRFFRLPCSGQTISALEWNGNGPLALLHHANGFCGALWAPVAEALSGRYRVIALDARGHGESSKPAEPAAYRWECFAEDLVEVCEQALAEAGEGSIAVMAGHSFGGSASVVAAATRPQLFRRLVLVDPVVPPPPCLRLPTDGSEAGRVLAAGARRRRRTWGSREEARRSWERNPFFSAWDPAVLALYVSEGLAERAAGRVELKCPPQVEAMIFEAGPMLDLYHFAERVRVPALLLHATRGSFPAEFHRALCESLAAGRLEEVAAGHLLPMEQPGLVAQAILGFAG